MCLILFAISPADNLPLVVAANRDEQHARPTEQADYWSDSPNILGGRDIQANGTWMGVSTTGRFAAVTNFAEEPPEPMPPRSRGDLTRNFLQGSSTCEQYLEQVHAQADQYRGFNLVISDGATTCYYSNREKRIRILQPGYYGLSNQLLDCTWAKVTHGREQLRQTLAAEYGIDSLFDLLACRGDGSEHSAKFIVGETYGTRACTVLRITTDAIDFEERNFNPEGIQDSGNQFHFSY